jgi:cell division protein FtsB
MGRGPQVVAFVLVLGLVGAMGIQPTIRLLAQRDRISSAAAHLGAVQAGNLRLEQQIARLNDPDYLEQRARDQIGLVRPGETTYVVMPPSDSDRSKRKRAARDLVPPPPPGFVDSLLHFLGL